MEYNSSQRKIRKNWDRVFRNRNKFRKLDQKYDKVNKKISDLNVFENIFQVASDFSFEWVTPTPAIIDNDGNITTSVADWSVYFPNITESMRNAIRPVIIRRFGNAGVSTNGELDSGTSLSENSVIYEVPQSRRFDNTRGYILNASAVLVNSGGIQGDIQFKLLLYIINGNTYI